MSAQDNKQLVMQGYQLFQNKDIQGLLALYTDDIEWKSTDSEYLPFAGTYLGKNQVGEFFSRLEQSQEALSFEPRTLIAEDEYVVVLGQASWMVRSTGRQYESPWVHVFTLRDGKVCRFENYSDTAIAEAAYRPLQPGQSAAAPMRH